MTVTVCYFIGTHGDWGGASRILLNIVRRLDRTRFRPIVMLSRHGAVSAELDRLGVEHHEWPRHDFSNPLRFARDVAESARFLRRHRVDVVHLNHGCIGWRPAELMAARLLSLPIVQHCQQPVASPSPDLRQATVVLTCSQFLQGVCNTGRAPKKTVYDLVEAKRFEGGQTLRVELGFVDEHVVFSFIGRTRRRKGLQMFVDLARRIDDPRARFIVTGQRVGVRTGDSYTPEEVQALIAGDDRIVFLGYRPDIENVFATSDVVVMPSQGDEACPAVLIESAVCGKPVIATRTGSTPEFVDDGVTGFVVDREDLDAMVERAVRLLQDPLLRRSIGGAARSIAVDRFVNRPIADVQNLYTELVR